MRVPQLVGRPVAPGARLAAAGDLLKVAKALLVRKGYNPCVIAGQTAIFLWILPLRMPLTGRTLIGFGFGFCL